MNKKTARISAVRTSAAILCVVIAAAWACKDRSAPGGPDKAGTDACRAIIEKVINGGDTGMLSGKLNPADLSCLNADQVRLLRNSIYARYGYRFKSKDLSDHFGKFSWYKAKADSVDRLLTAVDKGNLDIIAAVEKGNEAKTALTGGGDPQAFWKSFRSAVLAGDTGAVTGLTAFPFKTRGPLDHDPVQKHDKKAFAGIYARLIKSPTGLDTGMKETHLDFIRKTESIPAKEIQGNRIHIANMVFEKTAGSWRFAMAYME